MAGPLTDAHEAELAELTRRYGGPLHVRARIYGGFHDPVHKPDRIGEVCLVVRRPSGKLLLSIKTVYPRGAYRLPTGGIGHGELILDALRREAHEETGLELEIRRFLARIAYAYEPDGPPVFHTFAFLLEETGGTLGVLDPDEQIEEYREIEPSELPAVAARLEALDAGGRGSVGSWRDWGRFRAVVHRAVHDALSTR